jgi:hypothetical protein
MALPVLPFWFKQRQCKAEPQDDRTLKVTGPNLPEATLFISPGENDTWRAGLRTSPDAPESLTEAEFTNPDDAWEAAFELYRTQVIV